MHTLGSTSTPPGFHAGGLRYHGMAPLVSHLAELNLIEAAADHQTASASRPALSARNEVHRAGARGEPRRQQADRGRCAASARAAARPSSSPAATATSTWPCTATTWPVKLVDHPTTRGAGDGAGRTAGGTGFGLAITTMPSRRHRASRPVRTQEHVLISTGTPSGWGVRSVGMSASARMPTSAAASCSRAACRRSARRPQLFCRRRGDVAADQRAAQRAAVDDLLRGPAG